MHLEIGQTFSVYQNWTFQKSKRYALLLTNIVAIVFSLSISFLPFKSAHSRIDPGLEVGSRIDPGLE